MPILFQMDVMEARIERCSEAAAAAAVRSGCHGWQADGCNIADGAERFQAPNVRCIIHSS